VKKNYIERSGRPLEGELAKENAVRTTEGGPPTHEARGKRAENGHTAGRESEPHGATSLGTPPRNAQRMKDRSKKKYRYEE